jgi:hypothetical protein
MAQETRQFLSRGSVKRNMLVVGHLFSNVVNQEQGNTIVKY